MLFSFLLSLIVHGVALSFFFAESFNPDITAAEHSGKHGIVVGVGALGTFVQEDISHLPSKKQMKKEVVEQHEIAESEVADVNELALPERPKVKEAIALFSPEKKVVKKSSVDKPVVEESKVISEKKFDHQEKISEENQSESFADKKDSEKDVKKLDSDSDSAYQKATGDRLDNSAGGNVSDIPPNYLSKIIERIQYYKRYPRLAKKEKLEGVVHLTFTIARNGRITKKLIKKSSGYVSLDKATLEILEKIKRFPRFGKEIKQKEMTLVIPIEYTLIDR